MDIFTIKKQWNLAISNKEERELTERNHLWASEITKPIIDTWLKLKAVPPTNLPDERAKRKFITGNITEATVASILKSTGCEIVEQTPIELEIEGMKITGKIDFLYKGNKTPTLDIAVRDLREIAERINIQGELPEQMETILELKSLGTFGFNKVEATGKPIEAHIMQTFIYAYSLKKPAVLEYISRDDSRMEEFIIDYDDKKLLENLTKRVIKIKEALQSENAPQKENLINWSGVNFERNFGVQYSSYLTLLYENPETKKPFNHAEEYADWIDKIIKPMNKTLKDIALGVEYKTKVAQDKLLVRKEELENYLKDNNIEVIWTDVKNYYSKNTEDEIE